LPPVPDYTGPTDLYHMPILDMAALIESQTVSCVEVVQAFIDRLTEFDPYLGIVATPLYDTALTTAASHDALLASGTYVSPLMCIPFGVKVSCRLPPILFDLVISLTLLSGSPSNLR